MEPFDHMDEQERSWAHLHEQGERLGRDAAKALVIDPDVALA